MGGTIYTTISEVFAPSDEQAMLRVQQDSDARAFALLSRRWRERVVGLCIRLSGDVHLAEDVAQEVFIRLYVKRDQYRHESRFSTYLWRVAVNTCYDSLRRRGRQRENSLSEEVDAGGSGGWSPESAEPGPEETAVRLERAELVRRAVLRLPEHYRTVMVLRHYEGLKLREIAEAMEIPEGTVGSRIVEALNRMERYLSPRLADEGVRTVDQEKASIQNGKDKS